MLATEIVRLRNALAHTEAEFRRLTQAQADEATPVEEVPSEPLTTRILRLLDSDTAALTAPEIQARLGGIDPIDSVRTTLSKLKNDGLIARVRHGLYCSNAVGPEGGNRPEGGGP